MPNELNLNRREQEVLKVNIEGKSYSIPLGTSLKRKELASLKSEDAIMSFFEKYLGEDLMEDLTVGEIKTIVTAWSKATEETSGVSLGES